MFNWNLRKKQKGKLENIFEEILAKIFSEFEINYKLTDPRIPMNQLE